MDKPSSRFEYRAPPVMLSIMGILYMAFPAFYLISNAFYVEEMESFFGDVLFLGLESPLSHKTILTLYLSLLSGVCLFLPRKVMWIVGFFGFAGISYLNFKHLGASDFIVFKPIIVFPILTMLCVAFYFRHPFLDRRDRWYWKNIRYHSAIPCHVVNYDKTAQLVNISKGGACIRWEQAQGRPAVGEIIRCTLKGDLTIHAKVVWDSGKQAGMAFTSMTPAQKSQLRSLIKEVRAREKELGIKEPA